MNTRILLLLAGIALVAAGCTMAPKYTRPDTPVPTAWPDGAANQQGPAPSHAAAGTQLRWREFFTDAKLQQVIGTALANNRDLRLAALNVELARAIHGIQRDSLFPSVNAVGSASKQRSSIDLARPGEPRVSEQYSVNLGIASWEIDFFGRIRSLKDRALAEYLATEQARRSAQILLVSSVANTYLALAADRENLTLAGSTLEAQQAAYALVRKRFAVGVATELDLRRAETPVESARRDIARFTQLVAQDENALNLLVGSPVPGALLPARLADVSAPKGVFPGLPSEVLLRRPDVLLAENLLRASSADLGAARAAFFPRIALTTAIGTASNDLSGLFKSGTGTWSFAPQVVLPIFDARTWSAHRAAKVQQEIAVAQYEKTIQGAFREVADALAVRGTVDPQVAAQQSLVNAIAETHRLSNLRYAKGIDSYLGVLDAQRSLFAAQQGLVSLQYARVASQVRLYAVLGGGWEADNGSAPIAQASLSAQR